MPGPGQPLRYSKELTARNALRLSDYHSLSIRVDYRRTSLEFDPRRGVNVVEENEVFPIFGLIVERSW